MAKRLVIRVLPGLRWKVEVGESSITGFLLKRQAVAVAVAIGAAVQPSQVVIHKRNGQIEEERTFKADPKRRKG